MSKSPKLDPRLQYGGNPALEAVGANKWPPCQDHSGGPKRVLEALRQPPRYP